MLRTLAFAPIPLLVVLGLSACGGGGAGTGSVDGGAGVPGPGGSGGVGAGGSGGALDGGESDAGAAGKAGSEPCSAYIDCVAETTPAGLDAVLAAYGQNGSCWAEGSPALCDKACLSGLISAHLSFPKAEACNVCSTSSDCPSAKPACDVTTGRCVSCLADSDCKSTTEPGCDVATQTCVACTNDGHCQEPSKPRCGADHACVACTSNSDCVAGFNGSVCDAATHQCRGCLADSECASGACNGGACVGCKTDAQCGGSTPHCGSNGMCVQCTSNSECGEGVCTFGGCCGATACTDQGADCGSVIDISNPLCIFSPISCGSCSAGNTCVFTKCKSTPVNNCVPSACPSGKCGYVPEANAYQCIYATGSCTKEKQECSPGYDCVGKKSSVTGDYYYACLKYCLKDADCTNATKCAFISGPGSVGRCE